MEDVSDAFLSGVSQMLVSEDKKFNYKDNNLKDYSIIELISDGAKYKCWVTDGTYKYLYKESKKHVSGEFTKEHISEYLAYVLCTEIGLSCARVILKENAILSRVESDADLRTFTELSEEFPDSFHMSNLSTFNISSLLSREFNPYLSDVINMLLFDALIGNSDRHPNNFMYDGENFYPLFDNGSSLCSYIEEDSIKDYLKDSMRFKALCESKSKPVLRDEQKLTHKELVEIISRMFPIEYSNFSQKLKRLDINKVLSSVELSDDRYALLSNFLRYRLEWFKEI